MSVAESKAAGNKQTALSPKKQADREKNKQILAIVNQIFRANSIEPISNLSQEFADG